MISGLILILSAFLNAVMDVLNFHYSISVFKNWNSTFWDTKESSTNKYKNGNPEDGERFIGSTTVFVFLTDGWHLAQSLFLFSIIGAVVLYQPWFGVALDFLLYSIVFRSSFEGFYRFMKNGN